MSNKEPDVVHFKTDPGLKKLTEIVGGYFQVVEFPSKNCQVRGRAAIIHN